MLFRSEDYLVALADKIWKGRRVRDLEDLLVARISDQVGLPTWQVFRDVDEILGRLAEGSEERIAYQRSFPPMK